MARRGGRANRREDPPDVKLSKFLTYICRHGAEKEGIHMSDDGYVKVSEVLSLRGNRDGFTVEDVHRVVANCPKQRFALQEGPELLIRANQGHSMDVKVELSPIFRAEEAPVVVHGTYRRAWHSIKEQGLSRMGRTHIHFASGLPGESGVISGMRASCQVLIYINLKKALEDGIEFFRSSNDVILTPGNKNGFLLPCYFERVDQL